MGWVRTLLPPVVALLISTQPDGSAAAAAVSAFSHKTVADLHVSSSLTDVFRAQVEVMEDHLANLTTVITRFDPEGERLINAIRPNVPVRYQLDTETNAQLVLSRQYNSLRRMSLEAYEAGEKWAPTEREEFSKRTQELESENPPCDNNAFFKTLVNSAHLLDEVANRRLTSETYEGLDGNNTLLAKFRTGCTFEFKDKSEKKAVLDTIKTVQTHISPAAAQVAPQPEDGVALGSVYMILFIALSVLLAVVLLAGLAVLGYLHARGSAAGSSKRPAAQTMPRPAITGKTNPAFSAASERPAASLNETENWRWRRQGDAEPSRDYGDDPVTTRNAKKSTWGRIWGGVVKDYEQHSPAAREPDPLSMPRAHSRPAGVDPARPPPSRASEAPQKLWQQGRDMRDEDDDDDDDDVAPARPSERRGRGELERRSPPPRHRSPPPRQHSPPPRHRSPPPPQRQSPPPRRHSPPPLRRPSPSSDGGNWSYGASGRNKSTDSPFSSAW